jgi:hypothetical protein
MWRIADIFLPPGAIALAAPVHTLRPPRRNDPGSRREGHRDNARIGNRKRVPSSEYTTAVVTSADSSSDTLSSAGEETLSSADRRDGRGEQVDGAG